MQKAIKTCSILCCWL